jgi:hypothetical protein
VLPSVGQAAGKLDKMNEVKTTLKGELEVCQCFVSHTPTALTPVRPAVYNLDLVAVFHCPDVAAPVHPQPNDCIPVHTMLPSQLLINKYMALKKEKQDITNQFEVSLLAGPVELHC